MLPIRLLAAAVGAVMLTGCGLRVPALTELPADEADTNLFVRNIVLSVHCEVRNAVNNLLDADLEASKYNHGIRHAAYLDNWGVQIGLTLQVEEKTVLNPTGVWAPLSPPTSIFTLAGTASLTADATRIDKLNYYYTIAELRKQGRCKGRSEASHASGSLLIQSDLKLAEWLSSQTLLAGTSEISVPVSEKSILKQNALSHEVKFQVTSTGGLTPAWKLTRGSINQTGTFFSGTRDRLHDLIITFGPTDPAQKDSLASTAQGLFISSQFGLSVPTTVRLSN